MVTLCIILKASVAVLAAGEGTEVNIYSNKAHGTKHILFTDNSIFNVLFT